MSYYGLGKHSARVIVSPNDKGDIGCSFSCSYQRLYRGKVEVPIDSDSVRLTRDNLLLLKFNRSKRKYMINLNERKTYEITKEEFNEYSKNLSDRKSIILKNTFE